MNRIVRTPLRCRCDSLSQNEYVSLQAWSLLTEIPFLIYVHNDHRTCKTGDRDYYSPLYISVAFPAQAVVFIVIEVVIVVIVVIVIAVVVVVVVLARCS